MSALVAIPSVCSLVLGWLITIRLLGLARRTGAAPERILAMAFGSLAGVGYPLAGLSRAPGLFGTTSGAVIFVLGLLAIVAGIVCFARFPAVVFRPGVAWARALWLGTAALSVVGGIASALVVSTAKSPDELVARLQLGALAIVSSIAVAFIWNGIESFLYYGMMKRRLALGLADAVTTHRFLLWGIAAVFGTLQIFAVIVIRASGAPILAPTPALLISVATLTASVCWWLAFFMPDAYRLRFVEEHDTERAAPAAP